MKKDCPSNGWQIWLAFRAILSAPLKQDSSTQPQSLHWYCALRWIRNLRSCFSFNSHGRKADALPSGLEGRSVLFWKSSVGLAYLQKEIPGKLRGSLPFLKSGILEVFDQPNVKLPDIKAFEVGAVEVDHICVGDPPEGATLGNDKQRTPFH